MAEHIVQLQRRRDTAANWTADDTVLALGEMGLETDTGYIKIGDGSTAWSSLGYWHGPPWVTIFDGGTPTSTFNGAPNATASNFGVMGYEP
jgi:hypothetical protein